jgi:hypothetical protein
MPPQVSEADEDQNATAGLALVLMAELRLVKGLIIMGTICGVKKRQRNAHMFIYRSEK